MKCKHLLLQACFLLLAAVIYIPHATAQFVPADSARLISIEQQLADAIPPADTLTWKKYLSDDFFIVTEDGSRFNKVDFLTTFRHMPTGVSGHINIIKPKVLFHGTVAVVSYVVDEYENYYGNSLHTTYAACNTYVKTGNSFQMIASQVFEIPQLPVPVKTDIDFMQPFTGTYQLTEGTQCTVSIENDTLYIQKPNRKPQVLLAETSNVFFVLADTRGRKIFTFDADGKMIMRERRNGNDVIWRKIIF